MKRKLSIILAVMLLLSIGLFTQAYAMKGSVNNLAAGKTMDSVSNVYEKDNVKDVIQKNDVRGHVLALNRKEFAGIKDVNNLAVGNPYKVITADSELLRALVDGNPIADILAKLPYEWNVPVLIKPDSLKKNSSLDLNDQELDLCKAGTVYTIGKSANNKNWEVNAVGGNLSGKQIDFVRNSKILSAFLKSKNITTSDFSAHFKIPSLHMNLLYITSGQQEYFIPLLHSRQELYGLKNMNLYTRDEVVSAIGSQIKQNFDMMSGGIGK